MDTLRDGKSELTNTNKLIRNYKGATGLKTGSTGLALYNLSASATRDNLSLIAVIMKAPSTQVRFAEAQKLLDYGFNNFVYKQFAVKDSILTTLNVSKGVQTTVDCIYENDAGALINKGDNSDIQESISIPTTVPAPIPKGQKIGQIDYISNGEVISSVNILANENVKKISTSNILERLFFSWFRVLR